MEGTQRYVLMHKDDQVLSFEVSTDSLKVLDTTVDFAKAPFGMEEGMTLDELSLELRRFFNNLVIASQRQDYDEILKYTGVGNEFELMFKGHGLSLSNHYWFQKEGESLRYKDINFFDNGWDDSFGRAVLKGDYEALRNVSLNVPDILTPGWGMKGWVLENGAPHLYKLGIVKGRYEEPIAEALSSRLAQRIFSKGEALEYELKEIHGKYASVSKALIGVDEELLPLSYVIPTDIYSLYLKRDSDHAATKEFFEKLSSCGIPGLSEFFVKVSCFRSLGFVNDLHFNNLSAIRNIETGQIRLAPIFDLGSSFGSSERARSLLSNINKSTYILVYFLFSDLDPNWDYSWYHKEALEGFEDEIREYLSKSPFYTEKLIENIIDVYQHQLASLNALAGQ